MTERGGRSGLVAVLLKGLIVGVLTGLMSAAAFWFVYDFTEEFALTFGLLLTGALAAISTWMVELLKW